MLHACFWKKKTDTVSLPQPWIQFIQHITLLFVFMVIWTCWWNIFNRWQMKGKTWMLVFYRHLETLQYFVCVVGLVPITVAKLFLKVTLLMELIGPGWSSLLRMMMMMPYPSAKNGREGGWMIESVKKNASIICTNLTVNRYPTQ